MARSKKLERLKEDLVGAPAAFKEVSAAEKECRSAEAEVLAVQASIAATLSSQPPGVPKMWWPRPLQTSIARSLDFDMSAKDPIGQFEESGQVSWSEHRGR